MSLMFLGIAVLALCILLVFLSMNSRKGYSTPLPPRKIERQDDMRPTLYPTNDIKTSRRAVADNARISAMLRAINDDSLPYAGDVPYGAPRLKFYAAWMREADAHKAHREELPEILQPNGPDPLADEIKLTLRKRRKTQRQRSKKSSK